MFKLYLKSLAYFILTAIALFFIVLAIMTMIKPSEVMILGFGFPPIILWIFVTYKIFAKTNFQEVTSNKVFVMSFAFITVFVGSYIIYGMM